MGYHLIYVHGIYVVFPSIYLDIPRVLKQDFATGPCCWSHTCVGDQECFIPHATMAIVPGEKAAHKRLNLTAANHPPLSLAAAVTIWNRDL